MIEGVTLVGLRGPVAAAAVLCLGRRLACLISSNVSISPELIVVDGGGGVMTQPGPVAARWRAPEVRATPQVWSAAAELWSLGRLLLELALGDAVPDQLADHVRDDKLRALVDIDGAPLPGRLIEVFMVLMARSPLDRLQLPLAAARVLADAETRFGDGDDELARVFARAIDQRAADPSPDQGPSTAQLQRWQWRLPCHESTADLPAAAILTRDQLAGLCGRSAATPRIDWSIEELSPLRPGGPRKKDDVNVGFWGHAQLPASSTGCSWQLPTTSPQLSSARRRRQRQLTARAVLWMLGTAVAVAVAVAISFIAPLV